MSGHSLTPKNLNWQIPILFSFIIFFLPFYYFVGSSLRENVLLITEKDTEMGVIGIAGTDDCATNASDEAETGSDTSQSDCETFGCDKLAGGGISPAACGNGNCGDGASPDTAVWLASGSGTGSKCCGDDSGESFSSGVGGTGSCCNTKQIADDTFCSTNSKWAVDGTYCSDNVYDVATSGTSMSGDDIVCGSDDTSSTNKYICDTIGDTGSADGISAHGTVANNCDIDEVCWNGSMLTRDCDQCATGDACDTDVNTGGTTPTYLADGVCVSGANCDGSDVALVSSTYYSCSASAYGYQCDTDTSDGSFTQDSMCLSDTNDGGSYDCKTTGHACDDGAYTEDTCASCAAADGCTSTLTSGGDFSASGICLSDDSCDETSMACTSSGSYYSDCSIVNCNSADGTVVACDSSIIDGSYTTGGICGEADQDNQDDDCLTGAACANTEDSNALMEGCECNSDATDWDPYDSDVSDGSATANGICVGTTADTTEEACLSSGNYYTDCSNANCNSADGTAVTCDSSIIDGSYTTDGICGEAGNDGVDDDCLTGAACKDSESSNKIEANCNCASAITDWDAYDSGVSDGAFSADGICIGSTADTTGEACLSGSNYYNDCSSCTDGDECDSSIIDGGYSQDGLCSDSGTCTASGAAVESDNDTATVNSLKAGCTGYDGSPCISDVTAVSGGAADTDFDGICIGGTCDTDETAWDETSNWKSACSATGVAEGWKCDAGNYAGGLFSADGYCVNDTRHCCGDDSGEDIASGETTGTADVGTDAECGCSSVSDEQMCDADATGTFAADGICAKDAVPAWDCDIDEVCDDGTDIRDDCQQCDDGDTCWSSADGNPYSTSKNGICTVEESNCCTDFANGTVSGPDYCGTESQMCANAPTTSPWRCDDVDDASWDGSGNYLCDDDGSQCIECDTDNTDKSSATDSDLNGDGNCEVVCGADSSCDEVALGDLTGTTCCYGSCSAQTCGCTSATLDDDGDSCCYVTDGDYCSSTTGCTNATETCPDSCIDDNDGGTCAQTTRPDTSSAETCYWTDTCSDSGCSLTSSETLRADYCDFCNASGNQSGDFCPATNASCSSGCANSGTIWYESTIDRSNDCNTAGGCQLSTDTLTRGDIWGGTAPSYCDDTECNSDCIVDGYDEGQCVSGACTCNNKATVGTAEITDDYTPSGTGDYTIYCNSTITDTDGYEQITGGTVNATLWHTTNSSQDAVNDYDVHYTNSGCTEGNNDGANSVNYSCSFTLKYYANPGEWACNLGVTDTYGSTSYNERTDLTINSFTGYTDTSSTPINFGTLAPGETVSQGSEPTYTITNKGTTTLDINLSTGGDLSCTVGTIDDANIHFDTSSKAYSSMSCAFDGTACAATSQNFNLATRNSDDTTYPSKKIYFNIQIPVGVYGTCSTTLTATPT